MALENLSLTYECEICSCIINLDENIEIGELLECSDCGTEYEITNLEPITLSEAPMVCEDWGQ